MAAKTILIAEDDNVLRGILIDKLTQSGYTAVGAEDGQVAMDIIHSKAPDMLLLDILMPRKDGMQVLEELHADPKLSQIPVMIISNSGQPVEIDRARSLGARDFLVKAVFDPREVLDKVNSILGTESGTSASPSAGGTPGQTATQKTILVVEDDKFLRELLIDKLKTSDLRVFGAVDGKDAFSVLENIRPDLILLDIILPDINGFEILTKIRGTEKWNSIPVMILSNLDQKEDIDRAHALGVSGFLIKSNFSLGEIVTKVKSVLS